MNAAGGSCRWVLVVLALREPGLLDVHHHTARSLLLGAELLLGLATGAGWAWTTRIWAEPDGTVWSRSSTATAAVWAVGIALRAGLFALGAAAGCAPGQLRPAAGSRRHPARPGRNSRPARAVPAPRTVTSSGAYGDRHGLVRGEGARVKGNVWTRWPSREALSREGLSRSRCMLGLDGADDGPRLLCGCRLRQPCGRLEGGRPASREFCRRPCSPGHSSGPRSPAQAVAVARLARLCCRSSLWQPSCPGSASPPWSSGAAAPSRRWSGCRRRSP